MVGLLERKKVLIVGGGFAGVKTAVELSNNKHFDVTLLTTRNRFEYHGAMYRSATGKSPLEVVVPMREIFSDCLNVRVELDAMVEIRPQTKEVEGESGRTYAYDYLVMAVGYEVNYFNIPGMAMHSENMYDITSAIKLRHKLVGAFRSAKKGAPVCINIIGAGPTGVEVASDIKSFSKIVAERHNLIDLEVDVNLVEAASRVLPMLSEETSNLASERLQELGVGLLTNTKVGKCRSKSIVTNNESIKSDVTIWTAGNKANKIFSYYPDLFTLDEKHRVIVSEHLQANSPDIFVIGDAAATPYSGMAQTAIHNAIALTDNLKRQAEGKHWLDYKPKKPEYVVPVGGNWAVLETEHGVLGGEEGWKARRKADKWVLENFLVYNLANEHYEQGDKLANF